MYRYVNHSAKWLLKINFLTEWTVCLMIYTIITIIVKIDFKDLLFKLMCMQYDIYYIYKEDNKSC